MNRLAQHGVLHAGIVGNREDAQPHSLPRRIVRASDRPATRRRWSRVEAARNAQSAVRSTVSFDGASGQRFARIGSALPPAALQLEPCGRAPRRYRSAASRTRGVCQASNCNPANRTPLESGWVAKGRPVSTSTALGSGSPLRITRSVSPRRVLVVPHGPDHRRGRCCSRKWRISRPSAAAGIRRTLAQSSMSPKSRRASAVVPSWMTNPWPSGRIPAATVPSCQSSRSRHSGCCFFKTSQVGRPWRGRPNTRCPGTRAVPARGGTLDCGRAARRRAPGSPTAWRSATNRRASSCGRPVSP